MDNKVSLEFSVEKVEFEDVKDSRFVRGTIHAFADGENAHTHPIDTKVLIDCANSVYDIPVVCRYNGFTDDFMSHEPDETPIGFIKETSPTYSNPIIFEKSADGRTFLVIKALIWQKYSKDAIRAFKNSRGKKSVSVEITITKSKVLDGKPIVEEFVLDGITVLGDFVNPAVKDAHIQVEFAKDKNDYLNALKFATNEDKAGENNMNNEENMANAEQVTCASCENENMESGVQCAEGCESMSQDNEDMADKQNCESEMATDAECADGSENMAAEQNAENNVNCEDNNCGMAEEDVDANNNEADNANKEAENMSIEMAMSKIANMADRIKELEAQNRAYMAQIESMADYDNLKKYKEDNEKRIEMEANMATINKVMSDIASRGYCMSDDEKNGLIAKFSEFNSADAWSNYVKAQVFDNCNNSSNVQYIGLPFAEPKKTNSIWDSI